MTQQVNEDERQCYLDDVIRLATFLYNLLQILPVKSSKILDTIKSQFRKFISFDLCQFVFLVFCFD